MGEGKPIVTQCVAGMTVVFHFVFALVKHGLYLVCVNIICVSSSQVDHVHLKTYHLLYCLGVDFCWNLVDFSVLKELSCLLTTTWVEGRKSVGTTSLA